MRIKATKKFSKLGSANNYAGFGKEKFQRIEKGEIVDTKVNAELIDGGFVKEAKKQVKKEKINGN